MFILRNEINEIVGFGETPFVTSGNQTQEEIASTLIEYSQRLRMAVDKTTILADGIDAAQITIYSSTNVPSIDIEVNGIVISVAMAGGVGTLPPIVSQVADHIPVAPADRTIYSACGEGALTIKAV